MPKLATLHIGLHRVQSRVSEGDFLVDVKIVSQNTSFGLFIDVDATDDGRSRWWSRFVVMVDNNSLQYFVLSAALMLSICFIVRLLFHLNEYNRFKKEMEAFRASFDQPVSAASV
ncbi:hypothetical protein RB195_009596 [Necator americanus]|uniref:Transmembrane 9 superfamily member n=1 Tax=Necator americanus TaxID=51031 RepID=A0ABR1CU12_NECAM